MRMRFAPLQGETAKQHVPGNFRIPPLSTLVVWEDGAISAESDGLAEDGWRIPGYATHGARIDAAPRTPLLNVCYRFIARNRHRWFGTTCRLAPDPERLLP